MTWELKEIKRGCQALGEVGCMRWRGHPERGGLPLRAEEQLEAQGIQCLFFPLHLLKSDHLLHRWKSTHKLKVCVLIFPTGQWVLRGRDIALADVAQWIECRPAHQRVSGSIPSQDICLGCGSGPQ